MFSLTLETACIKLRSASINTRSWIQNLFFAPVPTLLGHSKCLYEAACETARQQEGSKALDSWLRVVGHCLLWNTCCFFCAEYASLWKIILWKNIYEQSGQSCFVAGYTNESKRHLNENWQWFQTVIKAQRQMSVIWVISSVSPPS